MFSFLCLYKLLNIVTRSVIFWGLSPTPWFDFDFLNVLGFKVGDFLKL